MPRDENNYNKTVFTTYILSNYKRFVYSPHRLVFPDAAARFASAATTAWTHKRNRQCRFLWQNIHLRQCPGRFLYIKTA